MATHPPRGDFSAAARQALAAVQQSISRQQRQLEALGAEARAEEWHALLRAAYGAYTDLYGRYGRQAEVAPVQTLADLAAAYWDEVMKRRQGAPTGLADLDTAIGGGLQPGKLMVLLGAPGSGKTTLANQIAEHIANAGRPVLYLTSEDTPGTLLAKTLSRLSQIDYTAVLQGYNSVKPEIDAGLAMLVARQSARRLAYLHDTGSLSLEHLQECARAHFTSFPGTEGTTGVVVVDYLQRLARSLRRAGGRVEELREAVTALTEQLRAIAVELECTILALSSQNRPGYAGNGTTTLASAKESGDIEYTADVILALAPEEKKQVAPGHAMYGLSLIKNRLGESGKKVLLDWYGARQHFTGVTP